ncbi:FAD:protein FMN transferase [Myroides guanonis]|nr:FAD:protein FMN transferase [Myroides guanonis]
MMMKMPQIVSKEYFAQTRFLFHCHFKVKIPRDYGEDLLNACFEIAEDIDLRYNSYQPDSFFSLINRNAGNWVDVDEDCVSLLKSLKLVSDLTAGCYDITCMPLIKLWGFYRKDNLTLPSFSDVQEVLKLVDYRKIEIDGCRVRIGVNQEIITGSFIKAFAVDKVIAFLKESGVTDAIVNAGGSSMRALNDVSHASWKINFSHPISNISERLTIQNESFSLSGKSNNHLIIRDKIYGHILNSNTGFPSATEQVGVVTSSAFLSDVLSTALHTVDSVDFVSVVESLSSHINFNYFRVEGDGRKFSDICF